MKISQNKVNKLLIKAIKEGDIEAVKYLVNDSPIKADIHMKNIVEDPEYVLWLSVEYNQLPILRFFLEETELKKYTYQKGIKQFVASQLYDTLNIMYEYAGQTGNEQLVDYLIKKLPLENKFDILTNAALNNHVHVMKYLIDNDYLSDSDKERLGSVNNNAVAWSIKYNSKEAYQYLMNYYKKTPYKALFNSIEFKISSLNKAVESIKAYTKEYSIFDNFYNDKKVKESYNILKKTMFYNKVARTNNVPLYQRVIEDIKQEDIKKQIILESMSEAIERNGSIHNYPIYKYILDTYQAYFTKEDKENIFTSLVYDNDQKNRFKELMQYSFLKKVHPKNILIKAFEEIYTEDTVDYIKEILISDFKPKIKLNTNNYYYFKAMNILNSEKQIEILKVMMENYPTLKKEKIMNFFEEDVQNYIKKWILNNQLNMKLTEKKDNVKIIKI